VLVHASTAYANCNLASTEERIYEPTVNAAKLVEAATTWMRPEMLDAISAQLLEGRPNTYTFAKALAESQLRKEQRLNPLPMIIIRPSIIGAIWKVEY
jgi:fatty acyl-CoA reductase